MRETPTPPPSPERMGGGHQRGLRIASDYALAQITHHETPSLHDLRAVADAYRAERAHVDGINSALLEALEDVIELAQSWADGKSRSHPDHERVDAAREVIALARGEG